MANSTPTQLRIFVSHSHKDDKACHALVAALRRAGADVWYDEHNMGSGKLMEVVEIELRLRPVVVVILSPSALVSEWVRDEAAWAYRLYKRDRKRIILPVLVEPVQEDEIWLWMQDFRRIEAPGVMPYPEDERIKRTLRVLTLTPAGERAVTPKPEPSEGLEDLLIQGNALQAQDLHAEALPFFERAALRYTDSFDAWLDLGYTLGVLNRHAEALPACERATTLDPANAVAWYNKGLALSHLRRYNEALAAYNEALARDSNLAAAWTNKSHALNRLQRYEEGLAACERSLALDSNDAATWSNGGVALVRLKRYDEALAAYDKAITLEETALRWNNKSDAFRLMGRFDEALQAADRALALNQDSEDGALFWTTKSEILNDQRRYNEALTCLDHALSLDAQFLDAWKTRVVALRALGRTAEADKADQQVKELGG